ncbi:MAG: ABC transporter ATP-binding protein [Kiloniellaceae bacterium]
MTVLIETRDLSIASTEAIVHPTSIEVRAGIPFTILGETGSGKSLLVQAIADMLPPGVNAEGRVVINGRETRSLPARQRQAMWGREIAVLPQEPWLALDPTARSIGQIAEGYSRVRGLPAAAALQAAEAATRGLGLAGAGRKLPHQLSGGMAQRVAFLAARAGGAPIVIVDEPTKGLDAALRDSAVELLRREMGQDGGLLTITHDIAVPRRLGGEVAIMLEGRIVEAGPVERVLATPQHDYTRKLIAADPAAWPRRAGAASAGAPVLEAPVLEAPVLDAQGVGKARGGNLLFRDWSFEIARGEIVGIVGPSGCGKSSFGDLLLGLLAPDSGTVRRHPDFPARRFQKIYQDPPSAFAPQLTFRETLADLCRLHRLPEERVGDLMQRLRLHRSFLDRRPGEISGGELQRLALLRVLLLDPVFLFADEPTSRLDLITQKEMTDLLVALAREQDCALLLVSHDLELVAKTADRVVEMRSPAAAAAAA